jgi:hypothetical protein
MMGRREVDRTQYSGLKNTDPSAYYTNDFIAVAKP